MKLAVATLLWALWAAATTVHAKGLLRSFPAARPAEDAVDAAAAAEGFVGMTLYIDHVSAGAAGADQVVNDALVSAYNKVHGDGDYRLIQTFKVQDILIPENNGKEAEVGDLVGGRDRDYYFLSRRDGRWGCTMCRDDRGVIPPLLSMAKAEPGIHQQFVDEFCGQLRNSGLAALSRIRSCGIDFTYTLGESGADATGLAWPWSHKKEDDSEGPTTGTIGVQVELVHVAGSSDEVDSDLSVVPKAIIEAYNEIHADTPFTLTSLNVKRLIRAPEGEDDGTDAPSLGIAAYSSNAKTGATDANASLGKVVHYYSYAIYGGGWGCRMCRADRALPPPVFMAQLMDDRHAAFEDLVQSKLVQSGHPEYQELRDVRIHFSYTGGDDVNSLLPQQQQRQ